MNFNQTHIDRLNQTTALVEANPDQWDQKVWHCGTSHCWAGFGDLLANQLPVDQYFFEDECQLETVDASWYGLSYNAWITITHCSNSLDSIKLLVAAAIKGKGSINLSCEDLTGVNLSGADLTGANLFGAELRSANLSGANLYGANLAGTDLTGTDFTGARLDRADLTAANLTGANLSDAFLNDANLDGANLSDVTLDGLMLSNS
jgi:uncharacterized protein YjbI with pentapeptide repeats